MYSFKTEGLILIKRKAETLIEIITAMAVFGVMLGGICDFLSNQTLNVAYIMKRDDIMYGAQWLINNNVNVKLKNNNVSADSIPYPTVDGDSNYVSNLEKKVSFDWDKNAKTLRVIKGKDFMDFHLTN